MQVAFRKVENSSTFFSPLKMFQYIWQLALVEIEVSLKQQTDLEVPLGSGHQEGGSRLLSRAFHRPIK